MKVWERMKSCVGWAGNSQSNKIRVSVGLPEWLNTGCNRHSLTACLFYLLAIFGRLDILMHLVVGRATALSLPDITALDEGTGGKPKVSCHI